MKKYLVIVISILIVGDCFSQAPNWAWAHNGVGINNDGGTSSCIDKDGNIFVTGYFNSPSIIFGTDTLINADTLGQTNDIFIVKYNNNGNVIWAKRDGGTNWEQANGISTDNNGNILITGNFISNSGNYSIIGGDTLSTAGVVDLFVAKYDPTGNPLWTRRAGGTNSDHGNSICTDTSGNVFVIGDFLSPIIVFGTDTLTHFLLSSYNVFIVKYDIGGNVIWAKAGGGTLSGDDFGKSIISDKMGNIYATGFFETNGFSFGTNTIYSSGTPLSFIVKFSNTGNQIWLKSGYGMANSIAIDNTYNLFITGFANPAGSADVFLRKYNSSTGNPVWTNYGGGGSADYGKSVATDIDGNIYVVGEFESSLINFGSIALTNNSTGTGPSYADIFVAKYDGSGNVVWAKSASGNSDDQAISVAIDTLRNVYITGYFKSVSVTFGNDTLINIDSLKNDVFIAKLDSTQLSVGNKEFNNQQTEITISPNPLTSLTTITFNEEHTSTSSVHTIIITDVLGNIINQSTVNTKQSTIDMTGFAKGIYFVRIEDEKKNVVNRKMIMQ